jgi:hypothetical protein
LPIAASLIGGGAESVQEAQFTVPGADAQLEAPRQQPAVDSTAAPSLDTFENIRWKASA